MNIDLIQFAEYTAKEIMSDSPELDFVEKMSVEPKNMKNANK